MATGMISKDDNRELINVSYQNNNDIRALTKMCYQKTILIHSCADPGIFAWGGGGGVGGSRSI